MTNNQGPVQPPASSDQLQADDAAPIQGSDATISLPSRNDPFSSTTTLEQTAEQAPADGTRAYDPIDAGLLNEAEANMLLDEFRHSFTEQFPFIVLDPSRIVQTLRREQPFLFLSIMASTSYRRPMTQRMLASKFRDQVGAHISACTLQGLEILQGLLIHAAYFQCFYMPGAHHLAVIMQLCVAVAQNLGQSSNARTAHDMGPKSERSAADKRALLGTYYMAAQ
jgi:hypothetical protein